MKGSRQITSEDVALWVPLLAAAVAACLMPAVADTFWHLRAGRDIVAAGHVSLVDRYSYTAAGQFWPDHEWLWQVFAYRLYATGGMPLLTAGAAALVLGALALAYRLSAGAWWTRAPLFVVSILVSAPYWAVRPQAFSLFALALEAWLMLGRRRWLTPVLVLVWANVHGAVLLGFVPLVAAMATAVWRRDRRLALGVAAIAAASFAATLATPLGPSLYTFISASVERSRVDRIAEWLPAVDGGPTAMAFLVMAAVLVVVGVRLWRRLPTFEDQFLVATATLLVPLALGAVRNVGPFAVLFFPAATRLWAASRGSRAAAISEWLRLHLEDVTPLSPSAASRRGLGQIVAAAAVALGLVAIGWAMPLPRLNWRPLTAAARDAIRACPGRVYNEYDDGGYLIWFVPEQPVFIDGRQDPYALDFLKTAHDLRTDALARARVFADYDIRCAALGAGSSTAGALRASGWHVTYADRRWTILAN